MKEFCKKTGKNEDKVNEYLFIRKRNATVNKKVVKFVEALWRMIFYTTFCVFGYQALFVPTSERIDSKNLGRGHCLALRNPMRNP